MARWTRRVDRLKDDHGWTAKPGYQIFVADRGAVRFDFPKTWEVRPGDDSIKFYDKPPPNDDCLLQVSLIHLPPGIDWTALPLATVLREVGGKDERGITGRGEVVTVKRLDLELVWNESWFTDPTEHRTACSRLCFARGSNIQACVTLDFWPEDVDRVNPVWEEVLRSLRLGDYVDDPNSRRLH